MSRDAYRGPKLPKSLLAQVQSDQGHKRKGEQISRKDRRKAERQEKKSYQSNARSVHRDGGKEQSSSHFQEARSREHSGIDEAASARVKTPRKDAEDAKPLKSILKKAKPVPLPDSESESEDVAETPAPILSRGVKDKLVADDVEIAALEKKLGIRGKKSKALETDGLDWLIDGSDNGSDSDFEGLHKRKRPEDARWLKDKRQKANNGTIHKPVQIEANDDITSGLPDGDVDADNESDTLQEPELPEDDEVTSADFEGFDSDDTEGTNSQENELAPTARRPRENPYVPPTSNSTAKYIPPSLRDRATSDEELLMQLRRQTQGLLNRLSEANMLSILKSVEDLYANNARQHVTSTIVDLLIGLTSDPSTLNDTFLILHAGFTTALYRSIGTDFGAHILEKLVENCDHHRNKSSSGKQPLNLLAFLSSLYTFQLVGSNLIFDYIRLLLGELSEENTELLLRIIRTCGQQLRQDDPSALKDIVLLLQRAVAAAGEETLSVRTKFMIETINDLKNNRTKTGANGTMLSEHTARMKKSLSTLHTSRTLKATEPLRITLSDIRDSEKKGKWWLVGASYMDPNKSHSSTSKMVNVSDNEDAGYESETPGSVDLRKLARAQGMNTDVRRAIFVAVLSSSDYKEAHLRLLKLHLKSKQQLEIPRVLVHCVGAEQSYNPFYELVARQFCAEHKLRKAFQFTLWDALREMKGDDENDDEDGKEVEMSRLVNLARFYGTLVAHHTLDVRALKKLDFTSLAPQQSMFVELFLTTILIHTRRSRGRESGQETMIKEVFIKAAGTEGLPQGLLLVTEKLVSKAEFASGKKEKKAVEEGCNIAAEVLREAAQKATLVGDDDDRDDVSE